MGKRFKGNFDNVEDAEIEETNSEDQWSSDAGINDIDEDIQSQVENSANDIPDPTKIIEPEIIDDNEQKIPPENKVKFDKNLGGKFLLHLCDVGFPLGAKLFVEATKKGKTVDIEKMKLDEEEKEILGPSAGETAEMLFGKMPPWQQFLAGLGVIYSGKVTEAIKDK